jgi:hypothetical protein
MGVAGEAFLLVSERDILSGTDTGKLEDEDSAMQRV